MNLCVHFHRHQSGGSHPANRAPYTAHVVRSSLSALFAGISTRNASAFASQHADRRSPSLRRLLFRPYFHQRGRDAIHPIDTKRVDVLDGCESFRDCDGLVAVADGSGVENGNEGLEGVKYGRDFGLQATHATLLPSPLSHHTQPPLKQRTNVVMCSFATDIRTMIILRVYGANTEPLEVDSIRNYAYQWYPFLLTVD
ncbi:unnamed protein product [Cyclocybe aegerita]|uniref:Uncharacterized protein n=1 Tax=Cyclocybe aegerita TaxID=1973307 RepID=A0A8S0X0X6_CYCAE|nr:unnamed protein product [Cyclocybe aegerita]